MTSRRYALGFLAIAAALILACSSGSNSPAPSSPTSATPSASGSVIDLGVITPAGTPGAGVTAPVVGIVSGLTGTCPGVTFVLAGVTIHVTSATTFESGTCADLQNGVRAGAIGLRDPTTGAVVAARVRVGTPPPPTTSVSGIVTALSGTCPALTFTLSGTVIHTTATTVFEGGTCADVTAGARAAAMGLRDAASGAIIAAHVRIAPPPVPIVTGTVASVDASTACPTLTFVVSSNSTTGAVATTVHVTAATRYEGGACSDIKAGVRLGAMGPRRPDGSIEAQVVRIAST